jgi:hypothetical protein
MNKFKNLNGQFTSLGIRITNGTSLETVIDFALSFSTCEHRVYVRGASLLPGATRCLAAAILPLHRCSA